MRRTYAPLTIILLLGFCVMMMFIGHTMPYPVMAPWLKELGMGMGALGWVSLSFSLGNLIAAPVAGTLVDRWGRRPVLIVGLVTMVVVNAISPLFDSFPIFVILRFVLGLGNAGIMPAAMAAAADITPPEHRGRWLGLVGGGVSLGTIFGPTVGGILYDAYGFGMPFYVSAVLALLAVVCVWLMVPETQPLTSDDSPVPVHVRFWDVIRNPPQPLWILLILLWVDFIWVYGWVSTEPAALASLYTDAGYTATMFGVVVGALGVTTALSEFWLGSLSDRYGRFPLIALGMIVHVTWYVGVAYFAQYGMLIGLALVSGFSVGLVNPALSAAYADIADPTQRGRIAGIREMVFAIGGILGPLTAVLLTDRLSPQLILMAGTVLLVATGVGVALVATRRTIIPYTEHSGQ